MTQVIIYSTDYCPYCRKAKELLEQKNIRFTEIRIDLHPELREEMITQKWQKYCASNFH